MDAANGGSPKQNGVGVLTPTPPSPSSSGPQHNHLLGLSRLELFKRANYTKVLLMGTALVIAFLSVSLSLLFLWRDYGLVDLLSSKTNYSRYLLILILRRAVPWTIFSILFSISLMPVEDQSFSNAKVKRVIISQVSGAFLGLVLMLVSGAYFLPEMKHASNISSPVVSMPNSTHITYTGTNVTSDSGGVSGEQEWRWDDNPITRKVTAVAAYAFCDYIALAISQTIAHPQKSVRVLLSKLRTNALPNSVVWL